MSSSNAKYDFMKKPLYFLITILFLTGCSHYYYVPVAQNVPLFKEKKEFRTSVILSKQYDDFTDDEISMTDIQAAYAVTDHFAVLSNYMSARGDNPKFTNEIGKGSYFDMMAGYYRALGRHSVFELYGGVGGSNQQHKYGVFGSSDLKFNKLIIQPSIGFTFSGFDIAFTSGFSRLHFSTVTNNIDPSDVEYFKVADISNRRNSMLFEPSMTIRLGWKYVKFQFQLIYSQNINNPQLQFQNGKASFGMSFSLANRYWNKAAADKSQKTSAKEN